MNSLTGAALSDGLGIIAIILFVAIVAYIIIVIGQFVFAQDGIILETEKPDLKCLFYNDGRFAVIDNMDYHHCHVDNWKLISWFLEHGYHIDAITDAFHTGSGTISARVYMSR